MPDLSPASGPIRGEVIGEPDVPGAEGFRLRRLGLPHDPEPILAGVEAHETVVTDGGVVWLDLRPMEFAKAWAPAMMPSHKSPWP